MLREIFCSLILFTAASVKMEGFDMGLISCAVEVNSGSEIEGAGEAQVVLVEPNVPVRQ